MIVGARKLVTILPLSSILQPRPVSTLPDLREAAAASDILGWLSLIKSPLIDIIIIIMETQF